MLMNMELLSEPTCCGLAILGTIFAGWATVRIVKYFIMSDSKEIRNKIKRKQSDRRKQLEEFKQRYVLNAELEKIVHMDIEQLTAAISSKSLTAEKVLEAFIAKALKVNDDINAITCFILEAEEWAKELDKMSSPKGPLHGIPVSIKDNCDVKGYDSTIGLGKYLYKPCEKNSTVVQVLMDLGAVPFCKTNVPQTLLSFSCSNPIFGETKNFHNLDLSPGGSSGGEASLIAAHGSIIGVGSDIGGSVRIPAHFCGIAGIKSTKYRFSSDGFRASLPNIVGVAGVPGLMARDAKTLIYVSKYLLEGLRQNAYDPMCFPIPWNDEKFSSKKSLRVGYFTSLPFFPVMGDTEKVMEDARKALESRGHTIVPIQLPFCSFKMMDTCFDFLFADRGSHLLKAWKGEPLTGQVLVNYLICAVPQFIRASIAAIMRLPFIPFVHSKRAVSVFGGGASTGGLLWDRLGRRKKMVSDLMELWKEKDLDIVLCPTFPYPAIPHKTTGKLQPSVLYTLMWNMFDFPSGVVKFGTESCSHIDSFDTEGDMVLRIAKKGIRSSKGMPITVQIVGLPYQEELVLRGMQELEESKSK